ncbi:hypothetical protein CD188_05170 [Limosilactobacillus fermentum]|nr:hypothetical protein CD188_05170 [Limosilactobacillus fermentum]
MDCVVTPLKTLMGFSVHLNVQLKFYNLPIRIITQIYGSSFFGFATFIRVTTAVAVNRLLTNNFACQV